MITIRPVAEYVADFPDDQIEDEHDIVQFGGRGVTEAIGEMLRAAGYKVSEPQDEAFKGWALEARRRGERFWLRVTDLGQRKHIMPTQALTGWLVSKLRGHARFLQDLDEALRRDSRFSQIKWYPTDARGNLGDPAEAPVEGLQ